ncbi:hypothetical protein [Arthrobacter sp. UYEF3]
MTRLHLDQMGNAIWTGAVPDWLVERFVDRRLPFQFQDASHAMLEL